MAKSKFPYLIMDAGRWWYIRRPPKDIANAFPPRIKHAFGTGDQRTAEGRWNAVHQGVEDEIRRVREEAEVAARPTVISELTDEEAKNLVARAWCCWVHLRKAETTSTDAFPEFALSLLAKLPANAHLWPATRMRNWYAALEQQNVVVIFTPFAENALRREIPFLLPALASAPIINVGRSRFFAAPEERPLMLKEMIEKFEQDDNRAELAATTKGNYRPAFDALLGLIGPEVNIRHIRRADILKVRDALTWLPAYHNKSKVLRDVPLEEIIARTKVQREAALDKLEEAGIDDPSVADLKAIGMPQFLKKTAINKYLGGITHLFDWAVGEEIIESTPASRLKLRNVAKSTKRSFSPEELLQLFPKGYVLGPVSWVPVLLLFQGLRPNEGCQLRTSNVIKAPRSGLWCLDISVEPRIDPRVSRKSADRSLKNEGSRRVIPV